MKEPVIRNKAHQRAKDDGWKFYQYIESGVAWRLNGRLYCKDAGYPIPVFLEIPEGNTGIRLYHFGSLGVEFFIVRRRWLRESHIWENQLYELLLMNDRMAATTKEIIRKEKKIERVSTNPVTLSCALPPP